MSWRFYRCLENSFKDFLDTEITSDNITDIDGNLINVEVGRKEDSFSLPCIRGYLDSETSERLEIGSNARFEKYTFIIEIYASNEGERLDLAKWVKDTINNGFRYYDYAYNVSNPESPIKTEGNWVHLDFLTNTRVALGENVDQIDAHRHRISVSLFMTK